MDWWWKALLASLFVVGCCWKIRTDWRAIKVMARHEREVLSRLLSPPYTENRRRELAAIRWAQTVCTHPIWDMTHPERPWDLYCRNCGVHATRSSTGDQVFIHNDENDAPRRLFMSTQDVDGPPVVYLWRKP